MIATPNRVSRISQTVPKIPVSCIFEKPSTRTITPQTTAIAVKIERNIDSSEVNMLLNAELKILTAIYGISASAVTVEIS